MSRWVKRKNTNQIVVDGYVNQISFIFKGIHFIRAHFVLRFLLYFDSNY